jgi:hypothetical protein
MNIPELFNDGEVGGAICVIALISVVYLIRPTCFLIRKWYRNNITNTAE